METLFVENFLVIKKATVNFKKINVVIGSQAQGKSVLAKLGFFFRSKFFSVFMACVRDLKSREELGKKICSEFEVLFPKYSWGKESFVVLYDFGGRGIRIDGSRRSSGSMGIEVFLSESLESLYLNVCEKYKYALNEYRVVGGRDSDDFGFYEFLDFEEKDVFRDAVYRELASDKMFFMPNKSIFIPASRSFFSNLQKNVFSFLAGNIDIDPFIKDFGSSYEYAKRSYKSPRYRLGSDLNTENNISFESRGYRNKAEKIVNDIIRGRYVYEKNQDWIVTNRKKINLSHASSGQQESIPMLVILSAWPRRSGKNMMYFIEEPEAHLFPKAQQQIMNLISLIYNSFGSSFFITTHSPYILTAINNSIMAGEAKKAILDRGEKLEEWSKVIVEDEVIDFDDVSAYVINDGYLEDIVCKEDRLVGVNLIDEVSDEFEQRFSDLLDIVYKDV